MESLKVRLTGASPLLLHNGQLADPLNPYAKQMKAVSGKRNKTDDDFQKLADLEYEGSLYVNDDGVVILPGALLEGAITGAAKKQRMGKVMQSAVVVPEDAPIQHDGPQDVAGLVADSNMRLVAPVKVQTARVMRTRPLFKEWSVETEILFDPEQVNRDDMINIVNVAGDIIGVGDWRPKFGRFAVEVLK